MKQKAKGISLIVLVITIIIIIILAGAVILSLSNSNVINKAKLGVMQTDMSTIKEQIKTKMAENELNNTSAKIGTQLWDSFYTMSVSQLQEMGVSAKNDYIYDYDTGNLSIKQNNDYVTPEELYGKESATNYIDGYVTYDFSSEEVTPTKLNAAATPTIKAALEKQQLAQKYTNGSIKVNIYDTALWEMALTAEGDVETLDEFRAIIANPKYSTQVTNNGYFLLNNITVEAGKSYSIVISNYENTIMCVKDINLNNWINKTLYSKTSPLKLFLGSFHNELTLTIDDVYELIDLQTTDNIKKYDLDKNGIIETEVDLGNPYTDKHFDVNIAANADGNSFLTYEPNNNFN